MSAAARSASLGPWIKPLRRKVRGYDLGDEDPGIRRVWRANTKLGSQPGGIGLFLARPAVGVVCGWILDGPDAMYTWPKRVRIERIDPGIGMVFTELA
jgi:hypothetical protein